jgi:hypothetical protein
MPIKQTNEGPFLQLLFFKKKNMTDHHLNFNSLQNSRLPSADVPKLLSPRKIKENVSAL